ncbi:MAG: [FeFe] hydrogenase H-cluster radical SAM maturase HydE [Lachnospiraceae bacterium]
MITENRIQGSFQELIHKLKDKKSLSLAEWEDLIAAENEENRKYAANVARSIRERYYGKAVYVRGLIEFTNYCRNDCLYCGIRRSNPRAERYRLSKEEILDCCKQGYELGFRTFVLQGGEDPYYTDERMADIIRTIKEQYPDCAITLSIGEKEESSYRMFFKAGAERYLLRHETADEEHYRRLHPQELSLQNRKKCLWMLKEIGYQVGCGFMVGSPGQTQKTLAQDMKFIEELQPQMVGIGPFVPHHDTPFSKEPAGKVEQTLYLLSLLRILKPDLLIPATTALGTLDPLGREKGMGAGANVVMPNLSPVSVRKKYELYDHKICTGEEAAECKNCLQARMQSVGYELVISRGDPCKIESAKEKP